MPSRRSLLRQLGVGTGIALAGCMTNGTTTPEIKDTSVTTTNTGCGSQPQINSPSTAETTLTFTGTLVASTPCHKAKIISTSLENGVMGIVLEPVKDDSQACVDCVGGIEFEAELTFTELPDELRVQLKGTKQQAKTFSLTS